MTAKTIFTGLGAVNATPDPRSAIAIAHSGALVMEATGTGTGTWSKTISFGFASGNDIIDIKTLTVSNLAPVSKRTYSTDLHMVVGWISVTTGTATAVLVAGSNGASELQNNTLIKLLDTAPLA